MTKHEELTRQKAQTALWKRGELSFLFDDTQMDMKRAFEAAAPSRKFIFLCSRRLGKSYLLCGLAQEAALKRPNTKIIYITSSYKAAKNIVQPIMSKFMETCPASVRPVFKTQDNRYKFPNGSEILLYGADRDPDSCRGQEADLVLVDEAGFVNKLDYLISSVLTPMLMMTNGRILMATTPPEDLDHPFMPLLAECEAEGLIIKRTIDDCPRVTPKMRAEYMAEAGGEDSPTWKREYLCQIIRNEQRTVIPEWTEEREVQLVREVPRHPEMDRYEGMDLGWVDDTALVFGWWDFNRATLVIEDELKIQQKTTTRIAEEVRAKEQVLWGSGPPYKRTADTNNPQLLYDLSSAHGLTFSPADKSLGKEAMINRLRTLIQNGQLIIHPRCRQLIAQLRYCKWKGNERLTFERSVQFGHFDLVDALIILVNSVNRGRNPIVTNYPIADYYIPPATTSAAKGFEALIPPAFRRSKKIKRFR